MTVSIAPASSSLAARRSAPLLSAYVLHSYDWSESSLILDLFTRERGRLAVAAKGAKRPYSQFRSVLLPFQRIAVSLGRAAADDSAEVLTLRAAEWAGGGPILGGAALFAGFYLNELLLKMCPRQEPSPALFDAYAAALQAVARPLPHYGSQSWLVFEGGRVLARGVWEAPGPAVAVER